MIIPVPRVLPRIVKIEVSRRGEPDVYIFLSDIIQRFIKRLFRCVCACSSFPYPPNSDLYIDEEEAENRSAIWKRNSRTARKERRFGLKSQRVQIDPPSGTHRCDRLKPNVQTIDGPINLLGLMSAYDLIDRPDLKLRRKFHGPYGTTVPNASLIRFTGSLALAPTKAFSPLSTSSRKQPMTRTCMRSSRRSIELRETLSSKH